MQPGRALVRNLPDRSLRSRSSSALTPFRPRLDSSDSVRRRHHKAVPSVRQHLHRAPTDARAHHRRALSFTGRGSPDNPAMASAAAVFAGKAMATSIISNIVNKAFDYLMDNHKAGGLKSARERLLPQIEVVFDAVDTEEIRDQSRALDAWLWQLRDAVEEAEDALDELDYYRLEKEVKKEQDNKVRKYKRKVIQGFSRAFNLGSLERLRNSVKTLDDVVAGVERFFQVLNHLNIDKMRTHKQDVELRNSRQTSSLPGGLLLGREEERKSIVHWLTKPESNASDIAVFSLVGLGGIGKSHLLKIYVVLQMSKSISI